MTYDFHIEPRDVLFLRDARPMEASDAGLGANWPRPDQIWSAFINAFHRRWPERQPWEHKHRLAADEVGVNCSFRFGALKTVGPFPYATASARRDDGTPLFAPGLYLPTPLDLCAAENGSLLPMRLTDAVGTDLPAPLELTYSSMSLGKAELPAWLHVDDYRRYLTGNAFNPQTAKPELYFSERNIGIGMDAMRGATADGKFYQAEYLRFHPEVRMAVQTECVIINSQRQPVDVFGHVAEEEHIPMILGGQQGVARVSRAKDTDAWLPMGNGIGDGRLLRWTLLTPAIFPAMETNSDKNVAAHPGGWLPNWVDAQTGEVRLPRSTVERQPGECREAWRRRIAAAPRFTAKLVAARIGKPLAFSGWDLQTGPKPTQFAVPAGAVYVFRCADREERDALAKALDWDGGGGSAVINRRSTLFGEKGFGLGICSTIEK